MNREGELVRYFFSSSPLFLKNFETPKATILRYSYLSFATNYYERLPNLVASYSSFPTFLAYYSLSSIHVVFHLSSIISTLPCLPPSALINKILSNHGGYPLRASGNYFRGVVESVYDNAMSTPASVLEAGFYDV